MYIKKITLLHNQHNKMSKKRKNRERSELNQFTALPVNFVQIVVQTGSSFDPYAKHRPC